MVDTQVAEKPATVANSAEESKDITVEAKLYALYSLQQIDSQVDKIRIVRGELPLEVQDLEDELEGMITRITNLAEEVEQFQQQITEKKNLIEECKVLIKKYESQQNNVRNNREFDSLSKEIEYQNLEIQLAEKRIREHSIQIDAKNELIGQSQKVVDDRKEDLQQKKDELDDIIRETEKEEQDLISSSQRNEHIIEPRLLTAYKRIRKNARNGLAVVSVERDACGGCFNKIPPQRQLDIRMRRKVIVCEYCGRILVDPEMAQNAAK
ncbi:MAG: hypothetical protein KKA07_15950 [Bacteroidetes bacterium]|nr:hypothetical protein [Bacteroidota bacterium]MBU1720557.1 hypothetical protein [Bacteroidota bacterium]